MKRLQVLVISLIGFASFAQGDVIIQFLATCNPDSLESEIYQYSENNDLGCFVSNKTNDQLIGSYFAVETGVFVTLSDSVTISATFQKITNKHLTLYHKLKGSIRYGPENVPIDTVLINDKLQLRNFSLTYAEVYQKVITVDDIFNNNEAIYFGRYCGFPPEEISESHYMDSLVHTKNLPAIIDWLASTVPEKQAFAIVALYHLESKGMQIDPEVKEMINTASKRKVKVERCKGCVISEVEMSVLISEIKQRSSE